MGPWYIRDKQNPFRPGCSFEVLLKQLEKGKIKPTTILRGPTTRQYWSVARNVPGISQYVGYCYACGEHVDKKDKSCGKCGAKFAYRPERDALGLDPLDASLLDDPHGTMEKRSKESRPSGGQAPASTASATEQQQAREKADQGGAGEALVGISSGMRLDQLGMPAGSSARPTSAKPASTDTEAPDDTAPVDAVIHGGSILSDLRKVPGGNQPSESGAAMVREATQAPQHAMPWMTSGDTEQMPVAPDPYEEEGGMSSTVILLILANALIAALIGGWIFLEYQKSNAEEPPLPAVQPTTPENDPVEPANGPDEPRTMGYPSMDDLHAQLIAREKFA